VGVWFCVDGVGVGGGLCWSIEVLVSVCWFGLWVGMWGGLMGGLALSLWVGEFLCCGWGVAVCVGGFVGLGVGEGGGLRVVVGGVGGFVGWGVRVLLVG